MGTRVVADSPDCSKAQTEFVSGVSRRRHTNPTNLLGYEDCALRASLTSTDDSTGASGLVLRYGPGSVNFLFGIVRTPLSDSVASSEKVKMGDMLVAVEVGKLPWTPETNWVTR